MSSFYDDASLVVIPSGYKTSKVYSEKPTDGSGDLAFTRTGDTATRVASNGLIEKVRTNLVLQSNTFSTTWTNVNSTETSGQAGYDGTNNAWLLTDNATNGIHVLRQTPSTTGLVTLSVYAKAGTLNWMFLRGVQSSANVRAWFNLSTGTIGTVDANGTAKMESVGNGWYRCSLTIANMQSGFEVYIATASGDNVEGYIGSGQSIVIQNCQYEQGDIATDYIPTTTAAVSVGPVSNVPRLDYLGSSCPRLLLEPQRTNLALYSENFDNAAWTKTNTTATANAATSPDGYTNAESILDNSTSGQHRVENAISSSIATGQTVAISFFAKKNTHDWCQVTSGGQTNDQWASFNLATGAVGNTSASANAKIENYGNGWYRLSIAATTTANNAILASIFSLTNNTNANTRSPSYVGTGGGVYIYGAQIEAGSYASSYVNTLSASVTRVADAASKTGISSLIGQTEGTIFLDFVYDAENTANERFSISDGTSAKRIFVVINTSKLLSFTCTNAGSDQWNISTSLTVGQRYKIAGAYKANDIALYVNGVQIGTDAAASIPDCSNLYFANESGTTQEWNNPTSQLLLFKTRLTNAQLAELTTL